MRDHFGWEYKKKHRNLFEAYQQLLRYREDLDNPPLLVVSDLDRFEIHTNFTGTAKQVYAFDLDGLGQPPHLDTLRKLFTDPDGLRPGRTTVAVTEEIASRFARLADGMRARGVPASKAAHFLMKLMFCMFAEDIGLLSGGLFSRALKNSKLQPNRLSPLLTSLFHAMAVGGFYGSDEVPRFNGGLFADADAVELTEKEIEELIVANEHDWASVEPSIFGTLFERTLDPDKRSQIGAHYTSREDIITLLEPVVIAPLRREWADIKDNCDRLWKHIQANGRQKRGESKSRKEHDRLLLSFVERLSHVSILDPACGSGNFLYVAIHLLLDLEKEVITYAGNRGVGILPKVRPSQLAGIEINQYAQQLAQVVIWIGYLQWMHHSGFNPRGIRSWSLSRTSGAWMPSWTCRIRSIPVSPSGRRQTSSWATRHFSAASCSAPTWATTTWTACSVYGRAAFPAKGIFAVTGLRKPGNRSHKASATERACWPPKASEEEQTARCWNASRILETFSSLKATGTGSLMVPTSMCPW